MKKRVLFVDHIAHRLTGSNMFFRALLSDHFDLEVAYIDPELGLPLDDLLDNDAALVILWQLDYLAPIFLQRGKSTVVVPMFDGSSALPDLHWEFMRGARVLCFSWNLYQRVIALGLEAFVVKYFPEPCLRSELPDFDELRGFIWQRKPEDGINVGLVAQIFGEQLKSLHVHNAPDNPNVNGESFIKPYREKYGITTSVWGADDRSYQKQLSACNVFIAPRKSEGIGMAFLEAMARGMLVCAHHLPTHNEYIANWVNGVLLNSDDPGLAHFSRGGAAEIAYLGWKTVVNGREEWNQAIPAMLEFIAQAGCSRHDRTLAITLAREIPDAFSAGVETYIDYLRHSAATVLPRTDANILLAASDGTLWHAASRTSAHSAGSINRVVPFVDRDEIDFTNGLARPFLVEGWSGDEKEQVWIEGHCATVAFGVTQDPSMYTALSITAHSLNKGNIAAVALNDCYLGSYEVATDATEIEIAIPNGTFAELNKISIHAAHAEQPSNGDPRVLSIALHRIRLWTAVTPAAEQAALTGAAN